jgi:hypothetical protein
MNENEIISQLTDEWKTSPEWYHRAAVAAMKTDRFWLIPTRERTGPYLLRMWLSPPILKKRGDRERFLSERSLLLHYFFRGDDDQALHDHPWDFSTRILAGGYMEHLPPWHWCPDEPLGPAWDQHIQQRNAGDAIMHRANELHCVGMVQPGTFTLVETGPEVRAWGFHPQGQRWIESADYLGITA